jgi:hypothetical protein
MKLKIVELRFGLRSSLTLLNKEGTDLKLKVPLIKGDLGGSKPLVTNTLLTLAANLFPCSAIAIALCTPPNPSKTPFFRPRLTLADPKQ